MAQLSLGPVTVVAAGKKVAVTVNQMKPTDAIPCKSILIQAFSNRDHVNTGFVYVLDQNGKRLATLAVPTTHSIPSFSATIPDAPQALNATDYFLDADCDGDGADVSVLRL